jgi:WSC domain
MPVYQSSSFGDVHGKVFAGGIQLLQPGSDGSYSIYVSATVNDNTCVLQELDLLTLQEKSTKFILSDETCPTLLPGIVSSQTNDVRSVVVLGTKIQNDGTHHGKAAVFHLDGGSFQGFTSSETMDSGAWTYPVDISYSKDFRASEILFFAPADGATVGSIEDYPTEWSPFVVAPPMASAIRIAQIHSKNYEKIVWTQEYVAHHANDPARPVPVFPAGLYTHPETEAVYVAGSTAGKGVAFGEVSGNTDDVDAFIIKLESNSEVSSARLGTAGHDYIISQCSPVEETSLMEGDKFQNTDPSLAEAWYVVGTTSSSFFKPNQQYIQGDGSTPVYRAFISKIDMEEMEEEWTVELAAPSETANANAAATKCVVDPATGDIYVTGSTTSLLQAETKDGPSGIQGNVDGSNAGLFLTRISSGGTVKWIQQFGSGDQSDRITGLALAPTNAVSTLSTVKDAASVLVTGHTNGDITRKGSNPTTTVLFVLSLDAATGSMLLNDVYVPSMPPPSEVPAIPPNSSPESIPDSFSDSYLGCWIDDGNDKAMDVQAPVATLSIKNCVAFCRDYKSPGDGYPYAALQNGSQCSCGFRYTKHGEAAEGDCNIQCASGPGICGGSLRISVYSTGATNPTAPPTSIPVPSPTKPPEPDPTSPPTMQPVASPTNPPEPDPTSPPIAQPGPEHTNQPESDVFYPPDIETFPPTAHADPRSDATVSRDGLAFQSNWGPSYSGAMVYDFTRRTLVY